ncbi:MAG: stage III sporulation protein AG [Lachnospiraceae bacterium]|nr:stage III sporulation protein AG [Lachnospiraceae bacterium]
MDKKQKKEPGMKEWAIILAAGVLLLLLSVPDLFHKEKEDEKAVDAGSAAVRIETPTEEYAERMETKLEEMLLKIKGVTGANVVITVKSTAEKVVLQDVTTNSERLEEQDGNGGVRNSQKNTEEKSTVLTSEVPYLTKELTPEVEGVVVVLSGAEGNAVLAITEAVQALFDVPAHKVKIIKD